MKEDIKSLVQDTIRNELSAAKRSREQSTSSNHPNNRSRVSSYNDPDSNSIGGYAVGSVVNFAGVFNLLFVQ